MAFRCLCVLPPSILLCAVERGKVKIHGDWSEVQINKDKYNRCVSWPESPGWYGGNSWRKTPTCKPMCLSKWEKTNPLNFFYIICGTWRDAELRNCALYNILHNIWKRSPSSKEMWWWWWVGWQGVVIVRKCCSCCPGHFNFIRDYKVWRAPLS